MANFELACSKQRVLTIGIHAKVRPAILGRTASFDESLYFQLGHKRAFLSTWDVNG